LRATALRCTFWVGGPQVLDPARYVLGDVPEEGMNRVMDSMRLGDSMGEERFEELSLEESEWPMAVALSITVALITLGFLAAYSAMGFGEAVFREVRRRLCDPLHLHPPARPPTRPPLVHQQPTPCITRWCAHRWCVHQKPLP
jgi:hypothetical protein